MKIRSRVLSTTRARAATVATLACLLALGVTGPAMGAHRHAGPVRRVSAMAAAAPIAAAPSETVTVAVPSFSWVRGHLPDGGSLVEGNNNNNVVVHAIGHGQSWQSIAESYLDLTTVYDAAELAKAIVKENLPESKRGAAAGLHVRIPHIRTSAPKTGAAERIGLPKDGVVKAIYVRGVSAGSHNFPALLERVSSHGMNAIVLDVKDYDGWLTYPSKVPLAVEAGAVKDPPIRSYARAVRFAHERGIRVIARVSCFNDQLMAKAHPGMAIRGVSGHVYRNGWLDPMNERAQGYVADLVRESIDAGVDEIQLDYVRFPVLNMKNIDFGLDTKKDPTAKIDVITHFVEHIHSITRARNVPLSLDVFGVIAFGKRVDMQNLGQDPAELAKHSEFLSPMVYPSHFDPGFMGFEEPGNHPELVGLGVKHMLEEMEQQGVSPRHGVAQIRPWLQAMRHKSTNYGSGYIQDEIRTGDRAGGSGWLLWNPGQIYDVAWSALPRHASPSPSSHAKAHERSTPSSKLHAVSHRTK